MRLARTSLRLGLLCAIFLNASAVSQFKFNTGGLKQGDYDADPASFVKGESAYYRGDTAATSIGGSHRWSGANGFSYSFPLGNGLYDVNLVFAENYGPTQSNGARVFDVSIEDEVVLKDFDVYKEAGGSKQIVKSFKGIKVEDGELDIAFMKSKTENPMVSGITIVAADGRDLVLEGASSGEGVGTNNPVVDKEFDHQAHAVTGGPYTDRDFNGDGVVEIDIDGTLSHSHYNNPDTGDTGKIVSYKWVAGGKVISTQAKFTATFNVGETELTLTVEDQTGDVATAKTTVTALPSIAGGAYCYYYPDAKTLPAAVDSDPKPVEGYSVAEIDFSDDEFQYTGKTKPVWAARCLTDYTGVVTGQVKLSVKYQGAGAALYVKGVVKATGGATTGAGFNTISATVTVTAGTTAIQVLYYRNGPGGSLQLLADDKVVSPTFLAFKSSTIIPTVASISPNSFDPAGAGQMQITGSGFFNTPKIFVGKATPTFTVVSSTEMVVSSVPSQVDAGGSVVNVAVANAAGTSNKVKLTYAASQKKGVAWQQTFFKFDNGGKVGTKQITSIAVGPDAQYYMGSLVGVVFKMKVGKNLVVQSQCTSQSLSPPGGPNRAILGVAFNFKSSAPKLYATSNSLYWGGQGAGATAWANGKIETFTNGCGCMCYDSTVITGLPVSNHDHGVNSLLFLDNGDLLISVGGATNAGHNTPGNKLGGFPETPLSGAILIAKLSKGAGFNGDIKYDQYTNPEKSKQISGDVEPYATGLRNCFGMTQLTNGQVWATDNGGNFGYGDVSKSCTEHVAFSQGQSDEVNLIVKGSYYGHPNRNRGQCVHSQFGAGVAPKKTVVSSTPGIIEYTSNVFGGNLKGEIILSKYAASGSGVISRYTGGTQNPVQMAQYSGLGIANGLHGEIVMPRVQQGFVAVLQPVYPKPATPMMIAVSPRKGAAGATVHIGGENFEAGMKVTFGTTSATDVVVTSGNSATCKVPAGTGKVKVTVTVGAAASPPVDGFDFIYL